MKWREATFAEMLEFARTRVVVDSETVDPEDAGFECRIAVEHFSDGTGVAVSQVDYGDLEFGIYDNE